MSLNRKLANLTSVQWLEDKLPTSPLDEYESCCMVALTAVPSSGLCMHLLAGKATTRPVRPQVAPGRDDIYRPLRCPDGRLPGGRVQD